MSTLFLCNLRGYLFLFWLFLVCFDLLWPFPAKKTLKNNHTNVSGKSSLWLDTPDTCKHLVRVQVVLQTIPAVLPSLPTTESIKDLDQTIRVWQIQDDGDWGGSRNHWLLSVGKNILKKKKNEQKNSDLELFWLLYIWLGNVKSLFYLF